MNAACSQSQATFKNTWQDFPGAPVVINPPSIMYTLLYSKQITNKDLLHTWNSTPCYVPAWMGGGFGGETVQSLSRVRLFATPWTAAHQASLSITNSQSLPKPMLVIELWCHPTISSSVVPFSSCPQSFPASGSFQMRRMDTHIWRAESLHCSPEITTTLLIGYTPIQSKSLKRKERILFPMKGMRFRSLVRELRSHMLWGIAKKKKRKENLIVLECNMCFKTLIFYDGKFKHAWNANWLWSPRRSSSSFNSYNILPFLSYLLTSPFPFLAGEDTLK